MWDGSLGRIWCSGGLLGVTWDWVRVWGWVVLRDPPWGLGGGRGVSALQVGASPELLPPPQTCARTATT